MRIQITLAVCLALASCASYQPLPVLAPETPQARLRFAVDTKMFTNVSAHRVAKLACEGAPGQMLGGFHKDAARQDKRLTFARVGIPVPAEVQENMYSEHAVAVDQKFFIQFGAALSACSGVVELPLKPGRDYEFRLTVSPAVCKPALLELSKGSSGAAVRSEVPLGEVVRSLMCG